MRKIITLIGFILIMFGIWSWSFGMILASSALIGLSFYALIIGAMLMIIGIATHPQELKEPFKTIAERFEEMNKPLLIASILIFFVSLWLLSYSFAGITYHHTAEYISYFIPVENASVSPQNASLARNITQSVIHNVNNTILIFSYLDILAGILCIASAVSILQKKHLSFIIASLSFAIYVAVMFELFLTWEMNEINHVATAGGIGISVGSVSVSLIPFYLLLPAIVSAIAMAIIIWKHKEFVRA